MKINIARPLILLILLCLPGVLPGTGIAEVNVNIGVFTPPPIVVTSPPAMVVIPGATYVYYAPEIAVDLFFCSGYWYRPHEGHWFRARSYRGPWKYVDHNSMPSVLVKLPHDYRKIPPGHRKVPYGQMKKNWRNWERDRYWSREANGFYTNSAPLGRSVSERKHSGHYGKGNGKRKD